MAPATTHPVLDPAIIERARAGDKAALTALLEHHYEHIHRMLEHLVGRSADLDDLRQQVLLAIVQGLPRFRGDSELATWIGGICVNVARGHVRSRRQRAARQVDDGEPAIELATAGDLRDRVESRAELARVEAALATLSADQRAALVLATVYGHSVQEVARMMKAATSTTRLRLYYGRKKFFAALARTEKAP